MLLPDNPEEDRPSKINYDPGIPTMGFTLESLRVTVIFVNRLVERMIDLTAGTEVNPRETGIVGITMRGSPLKITTKKQGEPVPFPVGVRQVVERAIQDV